MTDAQYNEAAALWNSGKSAAEIGEQMVLTVNQMEQLFRAIANEIMRRREAGENMQERPLLSPRVTHAG